MAEKLLVEFSGKKNLSNYVRMLVAGEVGSGITKFALTAPDPLWLAINPNYTELARKTNTKYIDIQSDDDLLDVRNAFREELLEADTIVLDRLDELQRKMFLQRMISEKRDFLKSEDWNWMEARLNQIVKGLCDLEKNVIILTGLKDIGGFDGQDLVTKPAIQGGFATNVYTYVDYSFLILPEIKIEDETYPNTFKTKPTHRYPWVFDKTETIDDSFSLTFDNDFDRILKARENMKVEEGQDPIEIVFGDIETSDEKEFVPGMSKDDKINNLLKKNKAKIKGA